MKRVRPDPRLLAYLRDLRRAARAARHDRLPKQGRSFGARVSPGVRLVAGIVVVLAVLFAGGAAFGARRGHRAGADSAYAGVQLAPVPAEEAAAASPAGERCDAAERRRPSFLVLLVPQPRVRHAAASAAPPASARTSGHDHAGLWTATAVAGVLAVAGAAAGTRRLRRAIARRADRLGQREPCIGLAVASVKGHVRKRNEDRCEAFRVACAEVVVVADGLGGHPGGAQAARIAVRSATTHLRRELPRTARDCRPGGVRALVAEAIWHAGRDIALAAARGGHAPDALRTTLVVAVALADTYVVGHIGDGGAVVHRRSGEVDVLLVPQKGDSPNVVAASLGPETEGSPAISVFPRRAGDLLLVMTDGVADRVPGTFPSAVRAVIDEERGDARRAVRRVLRTLAEAEDEVGYVFDDNMTLGLLGTPERTSASAAESLV